VLLAFDTATTRVTVALHDGERVVASLDSDEGLRHGELLAPAVQRVLRDADATPQNVSAIAVGVGPGPFTGLRVGLVTARTMALALGIPVHGVCTLDVLAAEAFDAGLDDFLVATDARRKEVYFATYDERGTRLDGPLVERPAVLATDAPVVGEGARLYPDAFPQAVGPAAPGAGWLARTVAEERAELHDPEPLYLRRPDAVAPGSPKPVS
jgi:tRNA threonylcarbamoyl adenosine modification protein YeaZ